LVSSLTNCRPTRVIGTTFFGINIGECQRRHRALVEAVD
jgi:hypothetical protein